MGLISELVSSFVLGNYLAPYSSFCSLVTPYSSISSFVSFLHLPLIAVNSCKLHSSCHVDGMIYDNTIKLCVRLYGVLWNRFSFSCIVVRLAHRMSLPDRHMLVIFHDYCVCAQTDSHSGMSVYYLTMFISGWCHAIHSIANCIIKFILQRLRH